jgi:hypothetical protein
VTLALVFAMSGGAYAASKYVITSTKQISPKVLKQLKGKNGKNGAAGATGPAGPQGPPGAAGAKGETGATGLPGLEGKAGSSGINGKSVAVTEEKTGTSNCGGAGGASFEAEGSGKKIFACNGKEGSPWTAGGTLPSGKTETGTWSVAGKPFHEEVELLPGHIFNFYWAYSSISFPIRLSAPLLSGHIHVVLSGEKGSGSGCPTTSSVDNPEAENGNLCIFQGSSGSEHNVGGSSIVALNPGTEEEGETATTGAILKVIPEPEGSEVSAYGTWAVTAE